jgi:tetratricopeptide (TPR) repeat protein
MPFSGFCLTSLVSLRPLPGAISSVVLLSMLATGCSSSNSSPVANNSPQPTPSATAVQPKAVTPSKPNKSRIPKATQLNNAGVEKLRNGDYKGAAKDFSQAIQENSKLAEAYLGRGISYSGLGNRQAALKDYNQAIRLKPNFAEAYHNRADEYIALGKQKLAIADLQKATKLFNQQGDKVSGKLAQLRLEDLKTLEAASKTVTVAAVPTNARPSSEQKRSPTPQPPRPVAAQPSPPSG